MSAEEIREVAGLGFEVGSHTCSHRDVTRLEKRVLEKELSDSKKAIEDITGEEVDAFSFPYGRYNQITAEAAFEAGYRRLFGLGSSSSEGVIPRVPIYRIDSVAAVLRKVEHQRMDIGISDFLHSFANISALLSTRETRKKR